MGKLLLDKDLNHSHVTNTLGANFFYHLCSQRTLAQELCYEITYKFPGGGRYRSSLNSILISNLSRMTLHRVMKDVY